MSWAITNTEKYDERDETDYNRLVFEYKIAGRKNRKANRPDDNIIDGTAIALGKQLRKIITIHAVSNGDVRPRTR